MCVRPVLDTSFRCVHDGPDLRRPRGGSTTRSTPRSGRLPLAPRAGSMALDGMNDETRRSLRTFARRDQGAAAHALEGDPADRAGVDPGRIDRRDRRADQHDQPGRQGGFQPALADPALVRHQGLRAGRARPLRDHARQDDAGGVRLAARPAGRSLVAVLALALHDADHAGTDRGDGRDGRPGGPHGFPRRVAARSPMPRARWSHRGGRICRRHQEHFWAARHHAGGGACCCSPADTGGWRRSRPSWSPRSRSSPWRACSSCSGPRFRITLARSGARVRAGRPAGRGGPGVLGVRDHGRRRLRALRLSRTGASRRATRATRECGAKTRPGPAGRGAGPASCSSTPGSAWSSSPSRRSRSTSSARPSCTRRASTPRGRR